MGTMSNWTSVPVRKRTRERLEEHPEKDGRDWDTFLRREVFGENIDGEDENAPEDPAMAALERLQEQVAHLPTRTADEVEGRLQ